MSFGNDPSATTNSNSNNTSKTSSAGISSGSATEIYGANLSNIGGSVTTSDYGAIKAGEDIALSGLNVALSQSQRSSDVLAQEAGQNADLVKSAQTGGLSTFLTPALWIGGGVLAIYFLSKKAG